MLLLVLLVMRRDTGPSSSLLLQVLWGPLCVSSRVLVVLTVPVVVAGTLLEDRWSSQGLQLMLLLIHLKAGSGEKIDQSVNKHTFKLIKYSR